MKTGLFSVIFTVVSNFAIGLCFIPFLLLCRKGMRRDKVYVFTGIYWLATGLVNLPSLFGFSKIQDQVFQENLLWLFSLGNTPLVLAIFFFGSKGKRRRLILLAGICFLIAEAILLAKYGYDCSAATPVIGISLLLILLLSMTGITRYMQRVEHDQFDTSLVFIYAALLFAYSGFIIIYIFSQVSAFKTDNTDCLLLYYISLSISVIITSLGLWGYGLKRGSRAY